MGEGKRHLARHPGDQLDRRRCGRVGRLGRAHGGWRCDQGRVHCDIGGHPRNPRYRVDHSRHRSGRHGAYLFLH